MLLWVDTFTAHFSPRVGEVAVRVLESAGYAVTVTLSAKVCCGLTWISTGRWRTASSCRTQLADLAARRGIHVAELLDQSR